MADDVQLISLNRFVFVMKAIAENDLWDEAALYLEDKGQSKVPVSKVQIGVLQELIKEKIAEGAPINSRGSRFLRSLTCGGVPQPQVPHGGGDGGVDGGHPQ